MTIEQILNGKVVTHGIMPRIRKPNRLVLFIVLVFFAFLKGVDKFIGDPQPGGLDPGGTRNHQGHHGAVQEDGIRFVDNRVIEVTHELFLHVCR